MPAGRGDDHAAVRGLARGGEALLAQELQHRLGRDRGDEDGRGDAAQLQRRQAAVGDHGPEGGLVVAADVGAGGADPCLAVPAGDVAHEVVERLRDRGVARVAQGAEDLVDRPAGVERAAHRVR